MVRGDPRDLQRGAGRLASFRSLRVIAGSSEGQVPTKAGVDSGPRRFTARTGRPHAKATQVVDARCRAAAEGRESRHRWSQAWAETSFPDGLPPPAWYGPLRAGGGPGGIRYRSMIRDGETGGHGCRPRPPGSGRSGSRRSAPLRSGPRPAEPRSPARRPWRARRGVRPRRCRLRVLRSVPGVEFREHPPGPTDSLHANPTITLEDSSDGHTPFDLETSRTAERGIIRARRQPLSGSSGRNDTTRSDSTHERLFIETKLRSTWCVRTLFERTKALARREAKVPVLALASKGRPGCLLVVDSADLAALMTEYAAANPHGPCPEITPTDCPERRQSCEKHRPRPRDRHRPGLTDKPGRVGIQ